MITNTDWNAKIKEEARRRKAKCSLEDVASSTCDVNRAAIERAIELLFLQRHVESDLFSCIRKAIDEEMSKL